MAEFELTREGQRLRILAQAPGHRFEVAGGGLAGRFRLEQDTLESATITLDLASLGAGDRLRDHELRRFLELDRNPRATAALLAPAALARGAGDYLSGRARFRFEIGSRRAEAEVTLSGDTGRARAAFTLRFTELGWRPPRLLLLSVKDELSVEVELRAEEIASPGV